MKQAVAELDEITGPAHRDGHVADGIFQNEVPTNNPRDNFAKCRVGIRVGRSGHRNHRRELGVTKRSERASDASYDERSRNGGTCTRASKHDARAGQPRLNEIDDRRLESRRERLTRRCGSSQRKNSRADDGTDADGRQRDGSKRAFHLPLRRGRFGDQKVRAFGSKKLRGHVARDAVIKPSARSIQSFGLKLARLEVLNLNILGMSTSTPILPGWSSKRSNQEAGDG